MGEPSQQSGNQLDSQSDGEGLLIFNPEDNKFIRDLCGFDSQE